ncbi:MAG: hypothetical protein ABL982_15135, partial [Vicinamibacterales bacterium]
LRDLAFGLVDVPDGRLWCDMIMDLDLSEWFVTGTTKAAVDTVWNGEGSVEEYSIGAIGRSASDGVTHFECPLVSVIFPAGKSAPQGGSIVVTTSPYPFGSVVHVRSSYEPGAMYVPALGKGPFDIIAVDADGKCAAQMVNTALRAGATVVLE